MELCFWSGGGEAIELERSSRRSEPELLCAEDARSPSEVFISFIGDSSLDFLSASENEILSEIFSTKSGFSA
jgi:hypothetical protein